MYQVDELFTPRELSVYLEIPVATLYAWRYRGQGPRSFRVGKHLRYRRSDVTDWISRQLESVSIPNR